MTTAAWHVYLAICADGSCYCGIAQNVERRLAQHNGFVPGGARFTRGRRPVRLAGFLCCSTKSEALRLEAKIKKMPKYKKLFFFEKGIS